MSSFCSAKLSATNKANATNALSLTNYSTGLSNKCWVTRKYHKNKIQSFCSKHFNSNKVTAQNNTKSQKETIAQAITEIPSELPATTSNSVEAEVSEEIDEVPPHKRLPSWANIPDVKSIDDLI